MTELYKYAVFITNSLDTKNRETCMSKNNPGVNMKSQSVVEVLVTIHRFTWSEPKYIKV